MERWLQFAANSARWRTVFLATLVLGLALVFILPAQITPPLAWSDSYMFGFDNHLAELLFGLLVIALGLIAKAGGLRLPDATREAGLVGPGGVTTRLLAICLCISALWCAILYWLTAPVGGVGDGAYFLDRIHLVARGRVPFRDFEFVYGSFSLSASVLVGRLLHVSAANGYYLIWLLETLLGVVLLWFALRWIDLPAAGKRGVFLLAYAGSLTCIIGTALNYCSLRYTYPLFALTGFVKLDRDTRWSTRAQLIGFAVLMAGGLLGLSPEEGIVLSIAFCLYLPIRRFMLHRPFVVDTWVLIALLVAMYKVASRAGAFGTMKGFAAGAFNLPVYPGPIVLYSFAAVILMVCYLATGNLKDRVRSNVSLLVLYGFGMLPGAMGRCDAGHLGQYLMAITFCAMLLVWRWPLLWRLSTVCFALFFTVIPMSFYAFTGSPTLSKAFLNHLYAGGAPQGRFGAMVDGFATRLAVREFGAQRGQDKMAALRNVGGAGSLDPTTVFPQASRVVAVPFEYSPNKLSYYQSPTVEEGYFMGLSNVVSNAQVQQKIDELRLHPEEDLVISPEGLTQCQAFHGERSGLKVLLLLPWVPAPKHEVTMFVPYCNYIYEHYEYVQQPSPVTFGYGLMRRKVGS